MENHSEQSIYSNRTFMVKLSIIMINGERFTGLNFHIFLIFNITTKVFL